MNEVSDPTARSTFFRIDLSEGPIGPGPDEAGNSDEIEIVLNGDGTDYMYLTGSGAPDNWTLGSLAGGARGANLNAGETDGIDVDVTANGITQTSLQAGEGNNTVSAAGPGSLYSGAWVASGEANLRGGAGNDTLTAGSGSGWFIHVFDGNDQLTGGPGIDFFRPGKGDDVIDGVGGNDTVDYYFSGVTQGVRVDLREDTPQNTIGAGTDRIDNVENANGSELGDTLIGDQGPNTLLGGVLAPSGADTLLGLGGNDTLQGEDGIDTASYAEDAAGVTVNLQTASSQPTGGSGSDTLSGVENLTGSAFADNLTGNDSPNTIRGNGGTDTVSLLGGIDVFEVADGERDTVNCGGDNDSGNADGPVFDTLTDCESPSFTDSSGPASVIGSGPGAATGDSTPSFAFTSEAGATFECRFDGGVFAPCDDATGPAGAHTSAVILADGVHTFEVRATDGFLNLGAPESQSFVVDTSAPVVPGDTDPPETTITKAKKKPNGKVKLAFTADEVGATFQCRLDGKPLKPCTSPTTYKKLKPKKHAFSVIATDAAGNSDATAATRSFRARK